MPSNRQTLRALRRAPGSRTAAAAVGCNVLKDMGEWRFDGLMKFSDAADRAEAALRAASCMGVKDLPGRFAEYLPLLREADSFSSCPLPWQEGSRERDLFVEGCSQVWHLLKAAD